MHSVRRPLDSALASQPLDWPQLLATKTCTARPLLTDQWFCQTLAYQPLIGVIINNTDLAVSPTLDCPRVGVLAIVDPEPDRALSGKADLNRVLALNTRLWAPLPIRRIRVVRVHPTSHIRRRPLMSTHRPHTSARRSAVIVNHKRVSHLRCHLRSHPRPLLPPPPPHRTRSLSPVIKQNNETKQI